jgi:hypothetical protein
MEIARREAALALLSATVSLASIVNTVLAPTCMASAMAAETLSNSVALNCRISLAMPKLVTSSWPMMFGNAKVS